ncbi:MAG: dihydrofolate reductase family protein [Pseudanabaena sp. M109S1SP2A07QC]|nr:dihydrofolate reductase family protein [Pseudanabaena sp. M109S1SP2A07QC]
MQDGKDIWLVGGAAIAKTCLENNLVDRFIQSIHPIILGEGIALFPQTQSTLSLKLYSNVSFA